MKKYITIIYILFFTSTHFSQSLTPKQEFDSLVTANTYQFNIDGNTLSGSGVDWLIDEADKSQYFLVGEVHGTADVANISSAIYSKIVGVGYNYAALEFGKHAGFKAEEILRKDGLNGLVNFIESEKNNQAIAFLNWLEESKLSANIVKQSPVKENALWGLDQEFIKGNGNVYRNT